MQDVNAHMLAHGYNPSDPNDVARFYQTQNQQLSSQFEQIGQQQNPVHSPQQQVFSQQPQTQPQQRERVQAYGEQAQTKSDESDLTPLDQSEQQKIGEEFREAGQNAFSVLRNRLRSKMNEKADYVLNGGCTDFAHYKELIGEITGMAQAERELLDLDTIMKRANI